MKCGEVKQITQQVAKPFIEKWHYSRRCPTGKNIFFGWYLYEMLYAVADYGIGVNCYQAQSLSKLVGYDVQDSKLLELKRLCRIEPKLEYMPLTRFIACCHKLLRRIGYCYIVSFSDPTYGHDGGVYKASNFTHLGKTNPEFHCVDVDGVVRHRRYYFRYAERNGVTVAEAREALGLKRIKTLPKDRWFIRIR